MGLSMKIDVFDTYVFVNSGQVLHFDVLVQSGTAKEEALIYAENYLSSVGVERAQLKSMRCDFCHTEAANEEVLKAISIYKHYILPMEGCPSS
jgi:Domain of unknown function (DUF2024)